MVSQYRAELARRAAWHRQQRVLTVDYYRIRLKVAFPLPLVRPALPAFPVRGLPAYPWLTWLSWSYDERLHALAAHAGLADDESCREAVRRELQALASWPGYRQYDNPDLSAGHFLRLLGIARRDWPWLGAGLAREVDAGIARGVDDLLPHIEKRFGKYPDAAAILGLEKPGQVLQNIPVIGTLGAATAARAAGLAAAERLDAIALILVMATLDLRQNGHTEGVAYDGYVMDFVADWLTGAAESLRTAVMRHPRLGDLLDESIALGVPGKLEDVAPLGDVEPVEMPFHLSAHAKLERLESCPRRRWLLDQCDPARLRADALAILAGQDRAEAPAEAPPAGILDAHHAVVLRTGWAADDLAVAASCCRSTMNHIQMDAGSIVIGTGGRWLIDDPGYQQYMDTAERQFTIGTGAHNGPVINGRPQTHRRARLLERTESAHALRVTLDLTNCYEIGLDGLAVRRTVWLAAATRAVVVADRVTGAGLDEVAYHWHGHPEAAWRTTAGTAALHIGTLALHIQSPQVAIDDAAICRLPGSRGQRTLCVRLTTPPPVVWWVFSCRDAPPAATLTAPSGTRLMLGDQLFEA